MSRIVRVLKLGRMSYSRAMVVQESSRRQKLDQIDKNPDSLLLVEHEPVYTVGIRSEDYSPETEVKLRALGADFQRVHRGGLITFHGPGQLVAYPVINLKSYGLGVRTYVESLEEIIMRTCAEFSVKAGRTADTGVWVDGDRKIAAIGVNARRYVTSHGLALNCNVDLDWFEHIVPCGLHGKTVTSLSQETGNDVTVQKVTSRFLKCFCDVLNCDIVEGQL